jgi:Glycosyl transferase family group 2
MGEHNALRLVGGNERRPPRRDGDGAHGQRQRAPAPAGGRTKRMLRHHPVVDHARTPRRARHFTVVSRPPVTVVCPFFGDLEEGHHALDALGRLRLGPGDDVIVADNTPGGVVAQAATPVPSGIRVLATRTDRQAYTARNEAAAAATGGWLLFTDADCVPSPDLLDRYFDPPPRERCGALAGEVVAVPARGIVAGYGAARGLLGQAAYLGHPHRPMAVTANLLVRRAAFEEVGGFAEGIRSGGDADLCWRLQDAGWELGHRPAAVVAHAHRDTLAGLLRQVMRDSAGNRWLARRHPGSRVPVRPLRGLLRAAAGVAWFAATLRPRRAAYKAVDACVIAAQAIGLLLPNA